MDPGTAIGLAGNAYKFVIFATEFVKDVKQVREKGGTNWIRDLDAMTKSIRDVTAGLETQLETLPTKEDSEQGNHAHLDHGDEDLRSLAKMVSDLGKELEVELRKLQVQDKSKVKAFKAVVRGLWSADEIKKLESRLKTIQSQLQVQILVVIKKKIEYSGDQRYQEMFTALERVASYQAQSQEDSMAMLQALERNAKLQEEHHKELLNANQALLSKLKGLSYSQNADSSQEVSTSIYGRDIVWKAEEMILSSLWYPSMHDREESIHEAHKKTLEWIYQDPKEHQKPWDSLVEFLEGTATTYWITGKPGSGKSTAMKFIKDDPRVQKHLKIWASGRDILSSSFYFFYNGPEQQKTELGLLFSLLHAILKIRRGLIQTAFEEKFTAACHSTNASPAPPSLPEARRALRTLIRENPQICFFFTIDGLDEFDPKISTTDVPSLLDLTDTLGNFNNVKLILSSRPLTAFEEQFVSYPSLRMHELTRDDIAAYVHERLDKHRRMQLLRRRSESDCKDLVESIVKHSSGVFLWVRLVVTSLLEGLTNHDDLKELQRRVEELPTDLHELYRVVLSRVEPYYRAQCARILLIMLDGVKASNEFSVLGMWYATQDEELVYATRVSPITDDDLETQVEGMGSRLKSRCRGLLEVETTEQDEINIKTMSNKPRSDIYNHTDRYLNRRISYLHRTVFEFLQNPEVRAEFLDYPELSGYYANHAVLRAVILVIKTCRIESISRWEVLLKLAAYAGEKAKDAELTRPASTRTDARIIWELDKAMSEHLSRENTLTSSEKSSWLLLRHHPEAHWSAMFEHAQSSEHLKDNVKDYIYSNFASFAIWCGLVDFIRNQTDVKGAGFLDKQGIPLFGHAILFSWPWESGVPSPDRGVLDWLISRGSSPNDAIEGRTIWSWFIWSLQTDMVGAADGYKTSSWVRNSRRLLPFMEFLLPMNVDINCHMRVDRTETDDGSSGECTLLAGINLMIQNTRETTKNIAMEDAKQLENMSEFLRKSGAMEQVWLEEDQGSSMQYELTGPPHTPPRGLRAPGYSR